MALREAVDTAELRERAEALVPLLRANALATERAGRVAPPVIAALAQAGVFRMTAPRAFGGWQAPMATQVEVLRQIARGCGSTSWVAAVYSVGVWMAGCFNDRAQDEVFSEPDVRVTLVAAPTGTLVPTQGGYVLDGRWGFNTGCLDGHWAIVGAPRPASEDPRGRDGMCALVPYSDLEVADDWHVSGLCGTGSRTISAQAVFVPSHRVLAMSEAQSGHHRSERHHDDPYYAAPIGAIANANSIGTPLGLAQGALEVFLAGLSGRPITLTSYSDRRLAPITHLQVGEAAVRLESAALLAARCAASVDRRCEAGEPFSVRDRAQIRSDLGHVTDVARSVAHLLLEGSGASSIHEAAPIQRIVRDLDALAQHAVLHPRTNVELYGRVLCGLEPHSVAI
jgi:3-hydroxy-9,10-secoandrosta-1,3,5(10)-triene-9,17-dione monooxygenase